MKTKFMKTVSIFVMLFLTIILLSGCMEEGVPADVQDKIDKYVGYWNTGQFDGIENVLCEDFELFESPGYESQKGIEMLKKIITDTRIAYPDFYLVIDETVYEKEKIAVRWSIVATNSGPGKMPPTGKIIKGKGMSVIHLKDGKIKDEWLANNNLLWMMQLGYNFMPPQADSIK